VTMEGFLQRGNHGSAWEVKTAHTTDT
jgi:hypothetical protein